MDRTPRPQINPVLHFPVFEPAPTLLLPDSTLMKLIKMRVDVVEGFLLHFEGLDVLGGDFVHHFDGVFDGGLDGGEECAAGPGCAGADDGVVVGETGCGCAHVEIGAVGPIFFY